MSNLRRLEEFGSAWCERLRSYSEVTFEYDAREETYQTPQAVADEFVSRFGFKGIGFNWEMLDASPNSSGPRSAPVVIAEAFEREMVMHAAPWLGQDQARLCANQFVNSFRPLRRTILSNRYDGLWNPITDATMEYAFVGFDDRKIALLLVTAED